MIKLVNTCGFYKAAISRALTQANEQSSESSLASLQYRLERLEADYQKFLDLHEELYGYSDKEGFVYPEQDIAEYESKHFETHELLVRAIELRKMLPNHPMNATIASLEEGVQGQPQTPVSAPESSTEARLEATVKVQSLSVAAELHFEKIRIPTFTGNYDDWNQLSDLFCGTIDSNANLSKSAKFHYLKSYLSGDALNLITHISVTDDNYKEAWQRLEQRYDKKSLIVRAFIDKFFSLSTANSSVQSMRKLSDGADEVIRGLNALKCNKRDLWLIYILLRKVDSETRQAWTERSESNGEGDLVDDFLKFLSNRCDALESCQPMHQNKRAMANHANIESKRNNLKCAHCQGPHMLSFCEQFKLLDLNSRKSLVMKNKLCFNCLSSAHMAINCNSKFRCRICNSKHHTLLHFEREQIAMSYNSNVQLPLASSSATATTAIVSHHSHEVPTASTVLPTILSNTTTAWGKTIPCRILLDTGSSATFISESFFQRTGIKRTHASISIVGIAANGAGVTRGRVKLKLRSRTSNQDCELNALILNKLTSSIPAQPINVYTSAWTQIRKLPLADPSFGVPGPIDIIVGSDQLWNIYNREHISFGKDIPIALKTMFGWVIAGSYIPASNHLYPIFTYHAQLDLDLMVRSFMELEDVKLSTDNDTDPAEKHFANTHSRGKDGVYIVQYPCLDGAPPFGSSLQQAIVRFGYLEKRFRKNVALKQQYVQFMDEYLKLGHMEQVEACDLRNDSPLVFYLAHHAIITPDSSTTKCRVVFDGSCKDEDGYSLNDRLSIGPAIQRDLFSEQIRVFYRYCEDV